MSLTEDYVFAHLCKMFHHRPILQNLSMYVFQSLATHSHYCRKTNMFRW